MILIYLCFKFWNFTMRLFHLLGFIKELVFGSSTSVTRLNFCFLYFLIFSRFFKESAGIVCHAFEASSRGCIVLELEMISFFPMMYNCFLPIMYNYFLPINGYLG